MHGQYLVEMSLDYLSTTAQSHLPHVSLTISHFVELLFQVKVQ